MIPAEGNYTLSIFSPGYTPISIATPLSFGENDFSYSLNLSTPTPTPIPTTNSGGRGSVRYIHHLHLIKIQFHNSGPT
jgi:hypothetical protein